MTPTEQDNELREQVSSAMYDTDYKQVTEDSEYYDKAAVDAVVELIQAHTNAEIAKVLDRLDDNTVELIMLSGENRFLVPLKVIQAERAKLKEV